MRLKNALRKHFIGVYDPSKPKEAPSEYLLLAKYISNVSDESDEETDDTAFYDGDGTPEEYVTSVSPGYSFEGFYDPEDPAQKLVADMKYKIGDNRRVWLKIVSADGKKQWEGVANVSGIKAGEGDASEYETFECTIKWIQLPTETPVLPA